MGQIDSVAFLKDELSLRFGALGSKASLRSVARSLSVDPGTLSRWLERARPLSVRAALHVAQIIELPPERKRELLAIVVKEHIVRLVRDWGEEGLKSLAAHHLIIAAASNELEVHARQGEDGSSMPPPQNNAPS